jgi:hypothetical protein
MTEDPAVSLASQRAMKQFAQNEPTVLLPAHDPEAAKRLAEGLTMYPRPQSGTFVAPADITSRPGL